MHRQLLTSLAAFTIAAATSAQTPSGATGAVANPVPHTTVPYAFNSRGTKLPAITWGLDQAWISEDNMHRGVNYAGADMIGIVRLSFQTTDPVTDGTLTARQKTALNTRINNAKKYAPNAGVNLNSDQEAGVDEWYHVYRSENNVSTYAPRWAALIDATRAYVESKGMKVVSVSPFNEPDYGEGQTWGWQQGSKAEMLAICRLLREDDAYREAFADILLCGGNTLNNDYALPWWNYCKSYLDEGNTHQLAGSFDNFAKFYQQVQTDGKTGVGDELHNIMECMVGSEYGLTKGIWWGTCEETRSQFMKATLGTRLGYAENRSNWTAASVYRHTDGSVQGFVGSSERQAAETAFRFAAMDHDVFYNGEGPSREFVYTIPGGTGYQTGQVNAETHFNIQGGDDIMPAVFSKARTYKLVNRGSGLLLAASAATGGATLRQAKASASNKLQQWVLTPKQSGSGDLVTYFTIASAQNARMYIDVKDWTLADRGGLILWNGDVGNNERWYLHYAGDGWFYIRSAHSAYYLEVLPGTEAQMKSANRGVVQGVFTGDANQQWRLIPSDVIYNDVAPAEPAQLKATPQPASVRLSWQAPADADLAGYNILRSEDQTTWYVINRGITTTAYIDNTVEPGMTYYYKVQAEDLSQNRSGASNVVEAAASGSAACVMHIACDSLADSTPNANHAAIPGEASLVEGRLGEAIALDGSKQFLQLPATVASSSELTVAGWFYWTGGNTWQRLFDFGTDTDHYFFVSPSNGSSRRLRLAIKNGTTERYIDASAALGTSRWQHVAVVFADDAVRLYLNGQAVATSTTITERPRDFRPIFNYVGRSQFRDDPMLRGRIDDIRIYNYALAPEDVAKLAEGVTVGVREVPVVATPWSSDEPTFTLDGRPVWQQQMRRGGIYVQRGRKVRY